MPPGNSPGFPNGKLLVASATPSAAASVAFAGLPASEFLFWEIMWLLGTSSGSDQILSFQVNGDSTSGHYLHYINDAQAGANTGNSDTAGYMGYVPSLSQTYGAGTTVIPAGHGGSTRAGWFNYGGGPGAGGQRAGYGHVTLSFNIASAATSLLIAAASGNITGDIRVYGIV